MASCRSTRPASSSSASDSTLGASHTRVWRSSSAETSASSSARRYRRRMRSRQRWGYRASSWCSVRRADDTVACAWAVSACRSGRVNASGRASSASDPCSASLGISWRTSTTRRRRAASAISRAHARSGRARTNSSGTRITFISATGSTCSNRMRRNRCTSLTRPITWCCSRTRSRAHARSGRPPVLRPCSTCRAARS